MAGPALVVVDMQERLFAAMDAERRDEVVRSINILVQPLSAWDRSCLRAASF